MTDTQKEFEANGLLSQIPTCDVLSSNVYSEPYVQWLESKVEAMRNKKTPGHDPRVKPT